MGYLFDTNIVSLTLKQNTQIIQQIKRIESKDLIMISNDSDLARIEGLNLENWS
ncbi:hypothetical protein ACN4EE_00810 [Geminocystis sp. CENA526]|uniref:hypothetical protein n=1 Tax=Geminocystis sp. CENA526 TaxID=1355871 RepID=UPI003D6DE6AA